MKISSLLNIGRGVTAIIGGGGKTTLMYTLARELEKNGAVVICTSTHILVPESFPLVTLGAEELRTALAEHAAVCAGTRAENGKLTASGMSFEELARLADYVLVEADGSRNLPLKAHAEHEPVIPLNAQRVVLVVGADGLGKPIAEACHRPELYAFLAGASVDDAVTPELAARVIAAEGLGDRVYINKVETAEELDTAQRLAELLRCPSVLGSLKNGVYTKWR